MANKIGPFLGFIRQIQIIHLSLSQQGVVVFQDILVACGLSDAVSGLVRRRCLRDRFCADHNCLVLPVLYTFVFVFVPVAVSPCLCTGDNRDRDSLLQTLLCVGSHAT